MSGTTLLYLHDNLYMFDSFFDDIGTNIYLVVFCLGYNLPTVSAFSFNALQQRTKSRLFFTNIQLQEIRAIHNESALIKTKGQ